MSPKYNRQIRDLRAWFTVRLAKMPKVKMTVHDYEVGTSRLNSPHCELVSTAFTHWLTGRRKYELSHNQMCLAFFSAARALGNLRIVRRG